MRYLLLGYSNPANWATLSETERGTWMGDYGTLTKEIMESGEFVSASPLGDITAARTVTVRGGSTKVDDGPFVEVKEHLSGYYIVDVADLDRALALAARIPDARFGAIEVRALCHMGGDDM